MKILVTLPLQERQKAKLEAEAPAEEFLYCQPKDLTGEQLRDAEVILGNVPPAALKDAGKLKWLQLNNAGTEGFCDGAVPEGVLLTNATGAYGLAISEHLIGMLFQIRKKLHLYAVNQMSCSWRNEGHVLPVEGTRVLVIGLGDIGRTFAQKMKALGCYVVGVKRRAGEKPDYVDELYTMEQLDALLGDADIIAMSLPGNASTYHVLNRERIGKLKETATVLNVGRGTAIDTEALTEALLQGRIGGAGLDVTDPEPLPPDHPLWKAPNAVITPHISGRFSLPETLERIVEICARNLRHYQKGEELENIVDFETGYCK